MRQFSTLLLLGAIAVFVSGCAGSYAGCVVGSIFGACQSNSEVNEIETYYKGTSLVRLESVNLHQVEDVVQLSRKMTNARFGWQYEAASGSYYLNGYGAPRQQMLAVLRSAAHQLGMERNVFVMPPRRRN